MKLIDLLTEKEKHNIIYKSLSKGEFLFNEGIACEYLGIVISGNIKIVSYSFSGNEIIYNSLFEGDIFGNNLIFSSFNQFRGHVIAYSETKVALIYKDNLISILKNNTPFLEEYLKIQSDFTKSLNYINKILAFPDAIDRFYYYMHMNNNEATIKSVSDLERKLYIGRETLSRLLSKLDKEDKIIKKDKNIKIIDY